MQSENCENGAWKRPDQIMKLHKFKLRKNALQARIKGTAINDSLIKQVHSKSIITAGENQLKTNNTVSKKRKNPFSKSDVSENSQNKKPKDSNSRFLSYNKSSDFDLSSFNNDSTLDLLNAVTHNSFKLEDLLNSSSPSVSASEVSETNVLVPEKGKKYIPIDWALKTKIRFMSMKPFAWKGKLKTSEEASGTTGFVRCLDISDQSTTLDTTPNARFHQCCLVWQHPSIPWLDLYPRTTAKSNIISTSSAVILNQQAKNALYVEWCNSFRSLFHLLRVRQCPYFYVCGNNFTVLFRAAGVCGISEVHALLTPTTRGLREAITQEEIQFTMPLRKQGRKSLDNENEEDEDESKQDFEEQTDIWFQKVGIDESEINKINYSQKKLTSTRESEKDNLYESLIFVTGVEAQALFNFIMNCKTLTSTSGALSHVPPTLLSPVAFHGATLKPLKVRENTVLDGKDKYFSLELSGPILPAVVPSICSLVTSSHQVDKFSISSAHIHVTTAFSLAKHGKEDKDDVQDSGNMIPNTAFGLENLTDCGFNKDILNHFCNSDPNRIQHFESLSYTNGYYTWT